MMKKRGLCLLLMIAAFCTLNKAYAVSITTGKVAAYDGLVLRSGPSTNDYKILLMPYESTITISSYGQKGNGCLNEWAEVIYSTDSNSYKGYACSTYFEDVKTVEVDDEEEEKKDSNENSDDNKEDKNEEGEKDKENNEEEKEGEKDEPGMKDMTDEEFDAYLDSQGFPEDYKVKLKELHKLHPAWVFKSVKTRFNWSSAMKEESSIGTSLLNVNASAKANGLEGYLSTAPGNYDYATDTFYAHDGLYWYQANNDAIAYYLDPRNFLNEQGIFMFEELFYVEAYQKSNLVDAALYSAFMKQFTPYFMEAGKTYNISPIYLASLSRQEVGTSDSNIVINGRAGVLSDGVNYTGFYNFYNYGASSSPDPKLKSLQTARAYGWNTARLAIVEGAYLVSQNYVMAGQYTPYLQKFNVAKEATKGVWHQWETNISAKASSSITTYNSYKSLGALDEAFSFYIPVFEGMPESTKLPNLGNPNNWLKELKVNGQLVTNFSGGTTTYNVVVPYSEKVEITATTVNGHASITGTGTKDLTQDQESFEVVVTAQNKDVKTYTLNITREEKPKVDTTPSEEPSIDNEKGKDEGNINDDNNKEENMEPKTTVIDVLKASGFNYDDNYLWNVTLATSVNSIINNLTKTYKTASVNIANRNNETKNEGTIVTGDKVTVSINGESKTLEVIIYGDTNGDGNISAVDLLNIQKHILGYTTLLGSYNKAADVNKDGKIAAVDLLNVQKHILGYLNISQN